MTESACSLCRQLACLPNDPIGFLLFFDDTRRREAGSGVRFPILLEITIPSKDVQIHVALLRQN